MNDVKTMMLAHRQELQNMGLGDSTNLWCSYFEDYRFDENNVRYIKGWFSWTLMCKYGGQDYHLSANTFAGILEKAREITQVDLATREILLSL